MRALDRKLLRDLWRVRGQGLAIALVIGCGVATLVMSYGMFDALLETREAYYERYRFAEVFATLKRAPEHVAQRIRAIPDVAHVETRIVSTALLDVRGMAEPATGVLLSLPESGAHPALNDVALRRGRMPEPTRVGEVLVGEAFAEAHALMPGDTLSAILNGRKRPLTVVGIALSPEYVYTIGPGQLVPDERRFGTLWLGRRALEAAFDLDGAFNQVSLTLRRGASQPAVIAALDEILEPYGGLGAYGRRDQVSHAFLSGEMDQLRAISRIIPPIFLAVAAFLLNVVTSRLVDTEREQIGLLKAFGYTNRAVAAHYATFVLTLVLIGVVFGIGAGLWIGRGMTELYAQFYRFPFLYYRLDTSTAAIAAFVAVGVGIGGTLSVVLRAARLAPAVAMAPPAPIGFRRSLLDRLHSSVMSAPTRIVIRHILRFPVRAALTTLGIALGVSLLIMSTFALDSIERMVDIYFNQARHYDLSVTFEEVRPARVVHDLSHLEGVRAVEPYRTVAVRLSRGTRERQVAIMGMPSGASLSRIIDTQQRPVTLPPEGLVLTTMLAALLDAKAGDIVQVEAMEGRRPTLLMPIRAVVEEYIGLGAYMDMAALNRMMGDPPVASGARLLTDALSADTLYRALKETPVAAGVMSKSAAITRFRQTMDETMVTMIIFYALFSSVIAFGVVYNSARIALSERGRELASLRVIGFTKGEVAYILLGQIGLLTLAALPLGCIAGYWMSAGIAEYLSSELYRVPLVIAPPTYAFAVVVVLASALLSAVLVAWRIGRLDLIAVLKTRE